MSSNQIPSRLVNPFLNIVIQKGGELLLPRVLALSFIDLAIHLVVPLDGVTAWEYVFNSTAGIRDHYNDDYWTSSDENSEEVIVENLELLKKHVEHLPDYVHLVGFNIFVEDIIDYEVSK